MTTTPYQMRDVVYDVETFKAIFTMVLEHPVSGTRWIYEASRRRNTVPDMVRMIFWLGQHGYRMWGFNNERFDYHIIHALVQASANDNPDYCRIAYNKAQEIINDQSQFGMTIWPRDRYVEQVDLFKIMHYDNKAKMTALKKVMLSMGAANVVDTPAELIHLDDLTDEQMDDVVFYNCNDVSETTRFGAEVYSKVAFRDTMSPEWINYNDTKIGKETFLERLQANGVTCFTRDGGRKKPVQTEREHGIHVGEKLMAIPFQTPQLQRMWQHFNAATIMPWETKGYFKDLTVELGGIDLVFGTGGIHASVHKKTIRSDDQDVIIDLDVTSYYPSMAIEFGLYPEHLTPRFVEVYRDLKQERLSHPKKSPPSEMLKLALNGTYGETNNIHSAFYDPAYTMAITINGQLLLAWLAEMGVLAGFELIQINTDGVTFKLPRADLPQLDAIKTSWEQMTRLELEQAEYRAMWVRDVNSYMAQFTDGKLKRIGAYEHVLGKGPKMDWHQDHSALVIRKAVEAYLVNGYPVDQFLLEHRDPFDFMIHLRVNSKTDLMLGDQLIQKTSRFFVSDNGKPVVKIMPPLAGKDQKRQIGFMKGWLLKECNNWRSFSWDELARYYYAEEARALIRACGS